MTSERQIRAVIIAILRDSDTRDEALTKIEKSSFCGDVKHVRIRPCYPSEDGCPMKGLRFRVWFEVEMNDGRIIRYSRPRPPMD